jgi:hypothetical protein
MTIKVPSLNSEPDYRAAKLLEQKLRSERDAAKVEALRLKALENFKYDDPDNHARIARIAAGETVEDEDEADNKELSRRASNRWSDLSDACDLHGRRMRDVNYAASKNICAKLNAEHDALLKRFFAGLVEVHNASVEYYQLRNDLMAEDIKYIGICSITPHTILGSPTDKQSPIGYLFREAKALGYISKIPAEFA